MAFERGGYGKFAAIVIHELELLSQRLCFLGHFPCRETGLTILSE